MLSLLKAPTGNTDTFNRIHVPNPLLLLLYGHAASKIRDPHHQQTSCIARKYQVRSKLKEHWPLILFLVRAFGRSQGSICTDPIEADCALSVLWLYLYPAFSWHLIAPS